VVALGQFQSPATTSKSSRLAARNSPLTERREFSVATLKVNLATPDTRGQPNYRAPTVRNQCGCNRVDLSLPKLEVGKLSEATGDRLGGEPSRSHQ
jgi:hypothetical protein